MAEKHSKNGSGSSRRLLVLVIGLLVVSIILILWLVFQ